MREYASLTAHLPPVDPALVDPINRMHRVGGGLVFTLAQREVTLHMADDAVRLHDAVALPLTIGAHTATLWLDVTTLQHVLGSLSRATQFVQAEPAQQALLAEYTLHDLLARLEAQWGLAVHFTDGLPQPVDAGHTRIACRMTWRDDASVHAIVLMLSAAVVQRLSASWVQAMPRASHSLSALTLPLAIQVGWQRLSLAQCRRLRPGDVVMLETFPGGARVTVADAVAAQAVAHASGMQLTTAFHPFPCSDELCMTAALAPSVDSVRDDPLDRIPIELVCEIARVQMPLGELRAIGVGTVLPAGPSTADVVDLRVNGQRVGRGELVRLGDGVGVRITQLTADA